MPPRRTSTLSTPPALAWSDFLANEFHWQQSEHVALVGPTNAGKSTLGVALLPLRKYVAVLGTKPRDPVLEALRGAGYRRMEDWSPRPQEKRVLLWPRLTRANDWRSSRPIYEHALAKVYETGGWCLYVDEARVICDERRPFLGLAPYLRLLWTQARSLNVSIVAGTQRPAWVPPEMFDQATHMFFFRDRTANNTRKLGDLAGLDADTIRATVPALGDHEVLYAHVDGRLIRTKVEP